MSDFTTIDTESRRMRPTTIFSVGTPGYCGAAAEENLLGSLLGADFNSTADQSITIAAGTWRITKVTVTNASISMTTAAGGIYTTTLKGGTAIVPAAQVYTALTSATVILNCTIAASPNAATPIYLSLTTGQGVAATADVRIFGVRI